jgi:hypothetical protein
MENQPDPRRGFPVNSHVRPSPGARTSSNSSRSARRGTAEVMVPDGNLDRHFVAYSRPGSNGEMRRAEYHSYLPALQNPDRRVEGQFRRRYFNFFGRR